MSTKKNVFLSRNKKINLFRLEYFPYMAMIAPYLQMHINLCLIYIMIIHIRYASFGCTFNFRSCDTLRLYDYKLLLIRDEHFQYVVVVKFFI